MQYLDFTQGKRVMSFWSIDVVPNVTIFFSENDVPRFIPPRPSVYEFMTGGVIERSFLKISAHLKSFHLQCLFLVFIYQFPICNQIQISCPITLRPRMSSTHLGF